MAQEECHDIVTYTTVWYSYIHIHNKQYLKYLSWIDILHFVGIYMTQETQGNGLFSRILSWASARVSNGTNVEGFYSNGDFVMGAHVFITTNSSLIANHPSNPAQLKSIDNQILSNFFGQIEEMSHILTITCIFFYSTVVESSVSFHSIPVYFGLSRFVSFRFGFGSFYLVWFRCISLGLIPHASVRFVSFRLVSLCSKYFSLMSKISHKLAKERNDTNKKALMARWILQDFLQCRMACHVCHRADYV